MNIFQRILFPFSGPKTKFLENKWWHRLMQMFWVIALLLILFIAYAEIEGTYRNWIHNTKRSLITYINTEDYTLRNELEAEAWEYYTKDGYSKKQSEDMVKINQKTTPIWQNIYESDEIQNQSEESMSYLKELATQIKDEGYNSYQFMIYLESYLLLRQNGKDIQFLKNQDKDYRLGIIKALNHLELPPPDISKAEIKGNDYKEKLLLFWSRIVLSRILIIYAILLLLQLIYFKGVIYVIYGNKGK